MPFRSLIAAFALALCVPVLAAPAMAADAVPAAIIAVVDMDRVLAEATAGKEFQAQLKKDQDSFNAERTKIEDELYKAEQELRRQRSVLSPEALDAQRKSLEERAAAAQTSLQARMDGLEKSSKASLATIIDEVHKVVADIAKGRGVNLVLMQRQVMMVTPELDITAAVVAELDKRMPHMTAAKSGGAAKP